MARKYIRKHKSHHYTKDEIETVIKNWNPEQGTLDDIAGLTGLRREQVSYIEATRFEQSLLDRIRNMTIDQLTMSIYKMFFPRMKSRKGISKYQAYVDRFKVNWN